MLKSLLMLALITVVDPVPGPSAVDSLVPPTGAMYRSLAPFDLRMARVLDEETVTVELELASYANQLGLPLGFSHPIIEVYLGGGDYGTEALLPGSGMTLPEGEAWSVALRLTGDRAWGFEVLATGIAEFEPTLTIRDGVMVVETGVPAIASPRLSAMVGLYSAFHETGWRPLETTEGPWAFSSETQVVPVVDVLALDVDAQRAALAGGILPVTEVNIVPNPNTLWLVLMAGGLVVAGAGLLLRSVAGRRHRALEAAAVREAREGAYEPVAAPADDTNVPGVRPVAAALASAMAASPRSAPEAAEPPAAGAGAESSESAARDSAAVDHRETPLVDEAHAPDEDERPRVGYFRGADRSDQGSVARVPAVPVADDGSAARDVPETFLPGEGAGEQGDQAEPGTADDLQAALDELATALGAPLAGAGGDPADAVGDEDEDDDVDGQTAGEDQDPPGRAT